MFSFRLATNTADTKSVCLLLPPSGPVVAASDGAGLGDLWNLPFVGAPSTGGRTSCLTWGITTSRCTKLSLVLCSLLGSPMFNCYQMMLLSSACLGVSAISVPVSPFTRATLVKPCRRLPPPPATGCPCEKWFTCGGCMCIYDLFSCKPWGIIFVIVCWIVAFCLEFDMLVLKGPKKLSMKKAASPDSGILTGCALHTALYAYWEPHMRHGFPPIGFLIKQIMSPVGAYQWWHSHMFMRSLPWTHLGEQEWNALSLSRFARSFVLPYRPCFLACCRIMCVIVLQRKATPNKQHDGTIDIPRIFEFSRKHQAHKTNLKDAISDYAKYQNHTVKISFLRPWSEWHYWHWSLATMILHMWQSLNDKRAYSNISRAQDSCLQRPTWEKKNRDATQSLADIPWVQLPMFPKYSPETGGIRAMVNDDALWWTTPGAFWKNFYGFDAHTHKICLLRSSCAGTQDISLFIGDAKRIENGC